MRVVTRYRGQLGHLVVGKDGVGVEVVLLGFSFGGELDDGGELEGRESAVVFLVMAGLEASLVGLDFVDLLLGKGLPWMSWFGMER